MNIVKKIFLLSLLAIIASDIQAIVPISSDSSTLLSNSFNIPKRSKFKKQRYSTYTLFGEAGMTYGYYTGPRYSFNFDGILQATDLSALSIRLGIGYTKATNDSTVMGQEIFFPIAIHVFFGEKNDFDMAGGIYYYENRQEFTPYLYIGFRHQNPKGGFTYRVGADIHLERVYDLKGRNLQKTAVYGPLIGLGWSF
ncbi:MAG TPA: hypothetical protein PKG63_00965 [Bacteroidales bacterium]|jgi:hypothetical protein|nr:hypothetical protein [Bacteroidales bacterium]HOU98668.1 hypothetical protein [Bacteroidales bacterium]